MKKRGFTLIELLAVIAILAILVILALPNVIKTYNKSKKQVFVTEAQSLANATLKKYASDDALSDRDKYVYCKSKTDENTPLDLEGHKKYYYTELDDEGDIKRLIVWDDKQYIKYLLDDSKDISELTIDDIVVEDMSDVTCSDILEKTNSIVKPDKTYTVSVSVSYSSNAVNMETAIPNATEANFNKVKYVIYRYVSTSGGVVSPAYEKYKEVVVSNKSEKFKYNKSESVDDDYVFYYYKVEAYTIDDVLIATSTGKYEYCFVAGTKVLTEDGYKNIEDIKVGEKVYSYNLDNNSIELNEVTKTIESSTTDTYTLTIGGEKIEMTPKHQLYIVDKGWVRAYDVKVGDKILTSDNKIVEISNIEYKIYEKEIKTYNLTVLRNNNYFVTDSKVLVHNASASAG